MIESNIGDTGRAISLEMMLANRSSSLLAKRLLKMLHLVVLQTLILNLSTGKKAILLILSSIGLASDYMISAGVLLRQNGGSSFALDEGGKISITNPGYTFLTKLQSGICY